MTTVDTPDTADLFSPAGRRERVVAWPSPGPVAKMAAGMSGMEAMCAIRDGRLPGPPMAYLIGFRMSLVEQGRIVMELDPEESLENTVGLLHGATAAALLDTAMGCAISTMLPAGQASVTLDLKLTYLRPLSVAIGNHCGGRQAHQAWAPDQLRRRIRARRQGQSGRACNRNLFHARRGTLTK
jgi:uncharacterized protein (TIGR00369 family)